MKVRKTKRIWYEILSSKEFNNIPVGETYTYDSKNIIGRVIKVNLGLLTRDPKLQNVQMGFEINEVKENKAYTRIKSYNLSNAYVKRVVKVGKSKGDDSFIAETKDKVKLKIKPIFITRYKVQNKVLTEIRNRLKREIITYSSKESIDKFTSELISKRIQKNLKSKLSKIYPMGILEFRIIQRL